MRIWGFAALALGLAMPVPAAAHFVATLSGAQEPMATNSPGTGTASAKLAADGHSLVVALDWAALSGPVVAAHIHCCVTPEADGGVAVLLAPAKAAAGTISVTIDLDAETSYTKSFVTGHGGTAAGAKAALLAAMADGRAYFNLHTALHPAGEIRGNIMAMKH